MSRADRELSLKVYQYVCNVIGTEEVVKTRRDIFHALDNVVQVPTYASISSGSKVEVPKYTSISSGSKAEGIDLQGSDYDQMLVENDFQVYEDEFKMSSFTNTVPIIMELSDTKPGFTKLKLYNPQDIQQTNMYVEIVGGTAYFSSKLFREYNLSTRRMVIHGPCQSSPDDTYDLARCLWCEEWITPAYQWVSRSRSSWPDHKLVNSVVKYGVLYVPIGCRGSANEDLEWRISFSMAEKQLIYSFSHTQLVCYALMKIILKDIIKKNHGDLICSYFLKTILFWLFEESSPSEWHPGNMILCFKNCFKRLIYCVEYKTCLHYFIHENNLFEGRFNENQHKDLLDSLNKMYNSLWIVVFHTATFQRYTEEQIISRLPYLKASSLSCLAYTRCTLDITSTVNRKKIITRIVRSNDKEVSIQIMSRFSISWMQSPIVNNINASNKSVYKQYQISLQCFKVGLYSDAVSAWTSLASLFYKHKRFNKCINIVNYTLSKCTSGQIMLHLENSLLEQTYFQKSSEVFGLKLTCKHFLIDSLSFENPYCLLPEELLFSIPHDIYPCSCRIPCVVYLQMLLVLCFHHHGDYINKLCAIRDMIHTIRNQNFIIPNDFNDEMIHNCFQIAKHMIFL